MSSIIVMFTLAVGDKKFLKQIFVQVVPPVGSHLKVADHSFVVREFEQDLDAYMRCDFGNGMACESVLATPDTACYEEADYSEIIDALIQNSWCPAKENKRM